MMAANHDDIDMTVQSAPGIWRRLAASLLAIVLIVSSLTMITAANASAIAPVLTDALSGGELEHCGPAPSKKQKGCTIHCLSWHVSSPPAIASGPKSVRLSDGLNASSNALIAVTQPIFDLDVCSKRTRPSGQPLYRDGDPLYAKTQRLRL